MNTARQAQRRGRFRIDLALIDSDPEVAVRILAGLLVVRAHVMWEHRSIEYVALGDAFSPVPPGARTPYYAVHLSKTGWPTFGQQDEP